MDRIIEKKSKFNLKYGIIAAVSLCAIYLFYVGVSDAAISTYKVKKEQVIISTVKQGVFEDVVPVRGEIEPASTVFLDAVAGGVVEEIYVDNGTMIKKGQPILKLQNSDLYLNVSRNNTSITEQLNNLSNIANNLETKKLVTEKEIIDIKYRIKTLKLDKKRYQVLADDALVSDHQYQAILDELQYRKDLLANLFAKQELEETIREKRIVQIEDQIRKLESNLAISTKSLSNLLIKAPVAGHLTSFSVEIGESKSKGERLGQIDEMGASKIVAQIDEFYINRVRVGQTASFKLNGEEYESVIESIYPEVKNGMFEVDLTIVGGAPEGVRRGQTIQLALSLGQKSESLLLTNGGFLKTTGGNWAFVLDESGEHAIKREIRLGRRNTSVVEVLEGLKEGERVVTSNYASMQDVERVTITR
ncbi:efflux RND transporter periplasmic adaptor subunit [Pseudoalteromonas sp. MMG013]|uniref:efflux RND transporter periplasmic adaptor subunit n=1 Tax=Pseudoalteromonas sp. MMG013 TaxID=2822687 RepID=UPI001B362EAB|nr:efflux RND transporter periplasmic adaptor subunit [Pseudoalteromonas sp. MMG013]MBQ4862202.1 efflux RND transporter periplasmic adaptor subunit [Pseudoalteromonas sp. MMG013]